MRTERKGYMRGYQNRWLKDRRDQWLKENGPCVKCGSNEKLEVDHIDPKEKITHKVWSLNLEKRISELKKCQVLCESCHMEKTKIDLRNQLKGTRNRIQEKYSDETTAKALETYLNSKISRRKIEKEFGIGQALSDMLYRFNRPDVIREVLLKCGGLGERARLLIDRMQDHDLPPQLLCFKK